MKILSVSAIGLLFLLATMQMQGQIAPNSYVMEAFNNEQIESMSQSRIEYLNYISQYAWEIVDIPEGKEDAVLPVLFRVDNESKLALDSALNCSELQSFNILTFRYAIKTERNFYRIEGCSKWLMIKSHQEITDGFNAFRNL
ncbi:MAG: hypothetical protein AB7V36_00450 [Bacteroidales bacterium]